MQDTWASRWSFSEVVVPAQSRGLSSSSPRSPRDPHSSAVSDAASAPDSGASDTGPSPVGASLAGQADFLKVFASNKKKVAVSKQITGLEESWNRKARENYAKAAELAEQATGLIK